MITKSLAVKATQIVWYVALALLVLVATYVAVGRNFFGSVATFKDDLEVLLQESLGISVHIGEMQGSWDGLDPVLSLSNVTVSDAASDSTELLRLESILIQPDMLASLFNLGLVFEHIELGDVNVSVEQTKDGRWSLQGLPVTSDPGVEDSDWDWGNLNDILASPTLELRNIRIHWKFKNEHAATWLIPVMNLNADGDGIRASGFVHSADDSDPIGIFSLHETPEVDEPGLNALLYLSWRDSEILDPVLDMLELDATRITGFETKGSVWLSIVGGYFNSLAADVAIADLQWQQEGLAQAPIEKLEAKLRAEKQAQQWQVSGSELEFKWSGQSLEIGKFQALFARNNLNNTVQSDDAVVSPDSESQPRQVATEVRIDRLNIGILKDFAQQSGALSEKLARTLGHYSPDGWMNNIRVRLDQSGSLIDFASELEEINILPYGGAPGGERINGYVQATADAGEVIFANEQLGINFPDLFFEPWTFAYGEGGVYWKVLDDGLLVSGHNLSLSDPNTLKADLQGTFSIHIPKVDNTASLFELAVGIREADVRITPLFVPGHEVEGELYQWLDSVVASGIVTEGGYFYTGLVGPSAPSGSHQSQMFFNVKDAELKFDENWPPLSGFNGQLSIVGSTVDGHIDKGLIGGTVVSDVDLHVGRDQENRNMLSIVTQLEPTDDDWRYWLLESPLSEHSRSAMSGWTLHGESQVNLDIKTSLSDDYTDIRLEAALQDMSLVSNEHPLEFTNMTGRLAFTTQNGFSVSDMAAGVLGRPANIRVTTTNWTDRSRKVQLGIQGSVDTAKLLEQAEIETRLPVKGDLDYSLIVNIEVENDTDSVIELLAKSDLQNTAIDAPYPFGKAVGSSSPILVNYRWLEEAQKGHIKLDWNKLLEMNLEEGSGGITRGLVRFNAQGENTLPKSGVNIRGRLEHLNVEEWSQFIRSYLDEAPSQATANSAKSAALFTWPDWLGDTDIRLGQLDIAGEKFKEVRARLRKLSDQSSDVRSREEQAVGKVMKNSAVVSLYDGNRINGSLQIDLEGKIAPIAEFERLHLSKADEADTSALLPEDIPLAQVAVNDLKLGDQSYGSWSWEAEARDEGVILNNVSGKVAGGEVSARLTWLYDPITQVHNSILTGELKGKNIEKLFTNWSKTAPITAQEYEVKAGIVWGQSPLEFDWANVSGQLSTSLSSGTITEASSQTQLFRVFGILNTDSITRRLKLDFSDLYKSGLAYDKIEGSARVQEGVFRIETPLAIQGPSSAYKITGQTSVVDDSLDLTMVVVLPLTQNLPLAALLVGAPQVGGALYLIDKLLGDSLSSLTSATYEVKGTFQDPQVKLKQIFDQSGSSAGSNRKSRKEND